MSPASVPECYFEKALKKARENDEPIFIVDDPDNGYLVIPESDPLITLYEDPDDGETVLIVYPDGSTAVPTVVY